MTVNPLLKKVAAAVAVKEVIEKIQESRQPKRKSVFGKLGRFLVIVGVGGAVAYAAKTGMLKSVFGKVKGKTGEEAWDGGNFTPAQSNGGRVDEPVGN